VVARTPVEVAADTVDEGGVDGDVSADASVDESAVVPVWSVPVLWL
jgi:hypothetical protein